MSRIFLLMSKQYKFAGFYIHQKESFPVLIVRGDRGCDKNHRQNYPQRLLNFKVFFYIILEKE